MKRVYASIAAMVGAYALLMVHVAVSGCFPLCVLYSWPDPEWFLFLCNVC